MTMQRERLEAELNKLLQPRRFRDYCPNGLQVEGGTEISRLVTGVTASEALIDRAIELNADCLLVHHGYFWRGENLEQVESMLAGCVCFCARRLQRLARVDLQLLPRR